MAKLTSVYTCQQCGYKSPQFLGKCPECDSWGTLVEEVREPPEASLAKGGIRGSKQDLPKVVSLASLEKINYLRFSTNILEFDRVLGGPASPDGSQGGGIVPGSLVLVSGDPGIGKSTLLTQLALNLSNKSNLTNSLYVAGEESAQQIKIRADRIKPNADLNILNEVDVDVICEVIKAEKPTLVIIDSIQTMETLDLNSAPGTIAQVRECAYRLQRLAKSLHIAIFLVGHVTKDGSIAGPKTLEHLVDVVLALEGDPNTNFRVLKTSKNRFGSTDEVGIFEMSESGLTEVKDPSKIFLDQKTEAPGSSVMAALTGQRTLMVEIQALTTKSFLPVPRRVGTGIDNNRLQLLVAVLSKRLKLPLFDQDIFVNVTGGLKVIEPAADLSIAMAIISSLKEQIIPKKTIFIGEVGLLGEIRAVRGIDKRIKEAKKLGFTKIISSENTKTLAEAVRLALFNPKSS